MKWMTRLGWLALGLTTLLAGCGGGGGGGAVSYTIAVAASRTQLPLNIAGEGPSGGGRYTAIVHVDAKDTLGNPVPGGDDVISCNITGGLDSGALYYLDGDPEHETTETIDGVEITIPTAYRSITLPSNAGGSSFHVHAGNIVGTVTVRCAVTEAGTNIQRSVNFSIRVGGPASGKISELVFDTISPNFLFVQGINGPTQVQIQANLVDEAGQVIHPPAGVNDMQVRIVPDATTTADDGARLRGVNAAGQAVQGSSIFVRSINGKAQFTVVSGASPGTLLLEAVADRSDGNVGNGINEPVFNLAALPITDQLTGTDPDTGTPLAISTTTLRAATEAIFYGELLEATGGALPYSWSVVGGGPPPGLVLSPNGIISGLPVGGTTGTYSFVAQVRDGNGTTAQKSFAISYTARTVTPPTPATAPSITTTTLAQATQGQSYATAVTATGGSTPYTWSAVGLPAGLSMSTGGVISGTPSAAGTYAIAVTVTGADGLSSSAGLSLTVVAPTGGGVGNAPSLAPASIAVSECTTDIPYIITGGTGPFISFSTNSVDVPTTTPVGIGSPPSFYVFTVSTTDQAGKLPLPAPTEYTITALDSQSRAATATIGVTSTHGAACPNFPKLTLSPTSQSLSVDGSPNPSSFVLHIQGGGDVPVLDGIVDFTVSSSDPSVATVGAVTGPTGVGDYVVTVTGIGVGTVIIMVSSEDGQNAFIPVFVGP